MRIPSLVLLFVLSMLVWARPAQAAESYANCTGVVAAVPFTISAPGTWCMKQSLATANTSGNAINIVSDNVTLDCNDFLLSGTAGVATTAVGIHTQDHLNVTVRHCDVEGFEYGVFFKQVASSGGHLIEDSRFDGNTYVGIRVDGDGSVIRRNLVSTTGGTSTTPNVFGIYASDSVDLQDNIVSGVTAATGGNGSAYGIYTINNPAGSISSNHVRGMARDGTGKVYGIFNTSSGRISLLDNDVFGDSSVGSVGLACTDSTGRAKDNVVHGFVTNRKACGDAGLNDFSP